MQNMLDFSQRAETAFYYHSFLFEEQIDNNNNIHFYKFHENTLKSIKSSIHFIN